MKKEGSKQQRNTLGTVRRMLNYITIYWQMKVTVALIILATILDVLTPTLIGDIIDLVGSIATTGKIPAIVGLSGLIYQIFIPIATLVSGAFQVVFNFAVLGVFSISLVVIASLTGFLNYLQRYALAYVSQKASFELRDDIYNALLDQSFSFYDQQRTGQIMSRATGDVDEVQRFFGFGINMVLSSVLLFALVIYSLLSMDWKLALLSLAFIPVMLFTTTKFASQMGPLWAKIRNQLGGITSAVQENLMGIRVVKGFAREDYEEMKFKAVCESYFKINLEGTKLRSFYLPLATLISSMSAVLIVWYGGGQVINKVITVGSLVTFYFYITRLAQPIRMIGFILTMFQRATASAERVFDIIDAKSLVSDKEGAIELKTVKGQILFKDVWFGYDKDNIVLKNINLDVKPGETIAILGATGSGKSSIINLIPRFYDVTKGSITIDGYDVRDVTLNSLRKQIGIVRQDPFIFSSTIKENIAYGVEHTTQQAIEAAAKEAKIHDFIASLPKGYDTSVGERGVTLSGGQKQRIAIARALLKEPKILILDDSTSSVDTQTEFEIQQALEELFENRTTFIITQRLSSVRKADYIVVLEKGEIEEEGTHEQLIAKKGAYYRLYQTQIAGEEETSKER